MVRRIMFSYSQAIYKSSLENTYIFSTECVTEGLCKCLKLRLEEYLNL